MNPAVSNWRIALAIFLFVAIIAVAGGYGIGLRTDRLLAAVAIVAAIRMWNRS